MIWFLPACEMNRAQMQMLTGALDGYDSKLKSRNAKKVTKCKTNVFGDIECYEY
tara:strand:- start:82 stop:243 length:162 start_codon:yes stop_codon:yes gene_type:complete